VDGQRRCFAIRLTGHYLGRSDPRQSEDGRQLPRRGPVGCLPFRSSVPWRRCPGSGAFIFAQKTFERIDARRHSWRSRRIRRSSPARLAAVSNAGRSLRRHQACVFFAKARHAERILGRAYPMTRGGMSSFRAFSGFGNRRHDRRNKSSIFGRFRALRAASRYRSAGGIASRRKYWR